MRIRDEEIGGGCGKNDDVILMYFFGAEIAGGQFSSSDQLEGGMNRWRGKKWALTHSNDPMDGECDKVEECGCVETVSSKRFRGGA